MTRGPYCSNTLLRDVRDVVMEHGPISRREIAERMRIDPKTAWRACEKLRNELVRDNAGLYTVCANLATLSMPRLSLAVFEHYGMLADPNHKHPNGRVHMIDH